MCGGVTHAAWVCRVGCVVGVKKAFSFYYIILLEKSQVFFGNFGRKMTSKDD